MAKRSTDSGEDPGLTFEEWEAALPSGGLVADDKELDEILSREPEPPHPDYCLTCQKFIDPDNELLVWVVDGPRYSPFCNVFCQAAYKPELALSIEE